MILIRGNRIPAIADQRSSNLDTNAAVRAISCRLCSQQSARIRFSEGPEHYSFAWAYRLFCVIPLAMGVESFTSLLATEGFLGIPVQSAQCLALGSDRTSVP